MKIEHLQDKHTGKPVFIVGNGNTFAKQDLRPLKGRLTICVNRNPLPFDPNYWVFMDAYQHVMDHMMDSKAIKVARKSPAKNQPTYPSNMVFVPVDHHLAAAGRKWKGAIAMGNSSTVAAMHLAWMMGCNPIVLAGVPLCIAEKKKRFHEDNNLNVQIEASRRDREKLMKYHGHWTTRYYITQRKFITFLARKMMRHGVSLYNSTEFGILDTIPKMRMSEAIRMTDPKRQHPVNPSNKKRIPQVAPIRRRPLRQKPLANQPRVRTPVYKQPVKLAPAPPRPDLDPKFVAFVTLVNDSFATGYICLIKSLLKYNPTFKHKIFILHSKKRCLLSDKNKRLMEDEYANVEFREVDESVYAKINFARSASERFNVSYFTLETFRIRGFKKVIFIDADILCLGNISYLIKKDVDFGVGADTNNYVNREFYKAPNGKHVRFNGGMLCVGSVYLNDKTFNEALAACYAGNSMAEQHAMNNYFRGKGIFYFDSRYNALKRGFKNGNNQKFLDGVRLLHFIGKKPWVGPKIWKKQEPKLRVSETGYDHLEKLWLDHRE